MRETVPEARGAGGRPGAGKAPADRFATAAEFARALEEPDRDRDADGRRAATARPRRRLRPRAAGCRSPSRWASAFLLGLGVLFGWLRSHGAAEPTGAGTTRSSPSSPSRTWATPTDEYFADGITDEVRGKLATLGGLKVIASSSAGQYKHSTKSRSRSPRSWACSTS